MKDRCLNPKMPQYKNYGGRGITICDRWRKSFIDFLEDVGRRPSLDHTLDRIDNNGNYEPGNVRWATPEEQQNNKRDSRLVSFNGETKTIAQWARHCGMEKSTLYRRIMSGWDVELALFTPPKYANSVTRSHKQMHPNCVKCGQFFVPGRHTACGAQQKEQA